jgi:hypothetical protein
MSNEIEITVTTEEKINLYADMKAQLAELKKAFEMQNAALIEAINGLEEEIKTDVLEKGETVRGNSLMAVWNTGRTTWNGALLKGLAEVYPEINVARNVGQPTVSFRAITVE